MAGIGDEDRSVLMREIDYGDEVAAYQDARLGEADEHDDAHLSPMAIGRGRLGTSAMARGGGARVSALRWKQRGRGFTGEREERGRGERRSTSTLSTRSSDRGRTGRAGAAPSMARCRYRER